jgi:hypothetical protein
LGGVFVVVQIQARPSQAHDGQQNENGQEGLLGPLGPSTHPSIHPSMNEVEPSFAISSMLVVISNVVMDHNNKV